MKTIGKKNKDFKEKIKEAIKDIIVNIEETGILTKKYWIIVFVLSILISSLVINKFLQYLFFSTLLLSLFSKLVIKDEKTWKNSLKIWPIIAAFFTLQGAVPIFSPTIDISLGDIKYGFIYEDYTTTWREFKIDINPPLILMPLDWLNCKEYDISTIKRWRSDASLDALKVITPKNPDPQLTGFYKTLEVCLNSGAKIDAWKLRKLSTSVYLESIQPVGVYLPNLPAERGGDNTNYITRALTPHNQTTYYAEVPISNDETFPVILWTNIRVKNDSDAYDSLRKLVSDNSCEKVLAYPVLELNNFTKIRGPRIIGDGTILGNYSIDFGSMSSFLNIERLEPGERKTYYFVFECEK